jgi:hypothetical protein
MTTPYRGDATTMQDPAEAETEERRKMAFASTFDKMVESNLQLVKTVRTAVVVVAASAILSLSYSGYATYSMHATTIEMRAMLQRVLDKIEGRS